MNEKNKLSELKRLVGDEVFESIVSTSKSLEAKATKQGLKFKEGQNMTEYEEFQEWREFQQFKAAKSDSAEVELTEAQLDELIAEVDSDLIEEKAMDYKAMMSELKGMRDIMGRLEKMMGGMNKRDEEDKKGKEADELAVLKAEIAKLQETVKELSQPVAPASTGFRPSLQHDPRELAQQQTKGYASANGIDALAAEWVGGEK